MKKVDIAMHAKAQAPEIAALLIRLLDTLIADCRYSSVLLWYGVLQ